MLLLLQQKLQLFTNSESLQKPPGYLWGDGHGGVDEGATGEATPHCGVSEEGDPGETVGEETGSEGRELAGCVPCDLPHLQHQGHFHFSEPTTNQLSQSQINYPNHK